METKKESPPPPDRERDQETWRQHVRLRDQILEVDFSIKPRDQSEPGWFRFGDARWGGWVRIFG